MISTNKIKKLAINEKKKIGKKAIEKINKILEDKTKSLLRKAARNADFAGRITIKEEDIEERKKEIFK